MSKVERKEYQEIRTRRAVSPVRGSRSGSSQNLAQFDNKLDYLLDDLQSSVVRPGTNTYREVRVSNGNAGQSNSLNRVTHLQASNPTTEYTSNDSYSYTLPDGSKSVKSYKQESYAYNSSGTPDKNRLQNNINQLDSLLDDLKHAKHESTNNNSGIDPGLVETKKSRVIMGKNVVERDVYYVDSPSSRTRSLDRSNREGSVTREIQYLDEGTYGETRPVRYNTPSPLPGSTSTISKQKKVTNVQSYPMEVVETTTPDINPEILSHLDSNLLPTGNTKVTTTIKTYTYEIPGSGPSSPTLEKYIIPGNDSITTPSKSFVYNKIENKELTNSTSYVPPTEQSWKANIYKESNTTTRTGSPYQKPASPLSNRTILKETTTTRNYQPHYDVTDSPNKQTYIYNEKTSTRNVNDSYPIITEVPRKESYMIRESHNTTTNKYPPQEPATTTYIYNKHDTRTTNYSPPPPKQPPSNTTVIYKETNTIDNREPNRYSPYTNRPNDPNDVNITYKYTTHSTSSNNYTGGYPPNGDSQPLLRPQPFPSNGNVGGPPKRVDELMAKIGQEPPDSPLNLGFKAHEAELIHQRKVDSLKQQQSPEANDVQRKERSAPVTKNITGPPVYYPPGHEMFAKKEEAGAWRAQGAMERESGKYKYESEGDSKYKVKTGAAVVPVCLPLCCGLPCTLL